MFFELQVKGHPSVFINPPRLADFKQVLNKAGLQVYYTHSVYVCTLTLLILYMPHRLFPIMVCFLTALLFLVQAEFSGGVLVCNKCVAVRKVCFS